MLSVFYGLMSALVWGAGDFAGGVASRRTGAFRVVLFGELIGLAALIPVAILLDSSRLDSLSSVQAALAGALGSLGLLLLYHSMAIGTLSIAAPVSALMAALLPVVVGLFSEGIPRTPVIMGFAFALSAVWLVSQNRDTPRHLLAHLSDLRLPLFAGIGFGSYFVLMHSAAQQSTMWPMVVSRCAGLTVVALFMLQRRESARVAAGAWPIIAINGIFDIGGNTFYILAGQLGRLDVSAVLSSLFPGATILLARFVLKEHLTRTQWLGIAAALIAIVLFTV